MSVIGGPKAVSDANLLDKTQQIAAATTELWRAKSQPARLLLLSIAIMAGLCASIYYAAEYYSSQLPRIQ